MAYALLVYLFWSECSPLIALGRYFKTLLNAVGFFLKNYLPFSLKLTHPPPPFTLIKIDTKAYLLCMTSIYSYCYNIPVFKKIDLSHKGPLIVSTPTTTQ